MIKLKYLFLLLPLFLFACKKEQPFNNDQTKTVNVDIKGYIMTDTLEFVVNDKVVGQAIDNMFTITSKLFNTNDKISVRTKAEKKEVGSFLVSATPYNQVKKIFYDGTTFADNLVLTPVKDPNSMGFRLRFSTTFSDFYGGPLDVEIIEMARTTTRPRVTRYTSLSVIKNVTASFGDFIELAQLTEEAGWVKSYAFKVYKAGTTELPYTSDKDLNITDPATNYGTLAEIFTIGSSKLLSISPSIQDGTKIGDGYAVVDFSSDFQ